MSESDGWNPNWWREAKAASLERRKREIAASALAQPGDSFLIVTEGTVTEPTYFDLLLLDLQLSAVRVQILPGDASDPRHVINTAEREAKAQMRRAKKGLLGINEPSKFDHVFAVVDTDVAIRNGIWNDVQQLAAGRKVKLAHSSPCFEFWLLLHISGYTTRADLINGEAAKRAVRHELGRDYSTNQKAAKEVMPSFVVNWPQAVAHAQQVRQYHIEAGTVQPANPSTEVDVLVRAMNDSAPEHLRKIRCE
jgi:hypothetical protein